MSSFLVIGVAGPAGADPLPTPAAAAAGQVVTVPVTFQVQNVNRSKVACAADGKQYAVRGTLVAPAGALSSPDRVRAVTLYLHGLSFGEYFWDFEAVGGYNYANRQAQAGQVSVVVDRLGYGASGKPAGNDVCVGSRADIAHQMVLDLRSGDYNMGGGVRRSPQFTQVFLAGHSYGGQIAQVEAYSFGDIDGLIVVSYTDTGQTTLLRRNAAYAGRVCAAGGQPVTPNGPGGYAPFGAPSGAPAALFHDVDPAVLAAAKRLLSVDPCGDTASFDAATQADFTYLVTVRVPVLLIQGAQDALFAVSGQQAQAGFYASAKQVSVASIPNTAHAVTLERTRGMFAADVLGWLRDQQG